MLQAAKRPLFIFGLVRNKTLQVNKIHRTEEGRDHCTSLVYLVDTGVHQLLAGEVEAGEGLGHVDEAARGGRAAGVLAAAEQQGEGLGHDVGGLGLALRHGGVREDVRPEEGGISYGFL